MTIIPNYTNFTNPALYPQLVNDASGGIFWSFILWGVFGVFFLLAMRYNKIELAVMYSSFILSVISLFMAYANLVSWVQFTVYVSLLLGSIIYTLVLGDKPD